MRTPGAATVVVPALVLAVLAVPGCGGGPAPSRSAHRLALTVVVTGDAALARQTRSRLGMPLAVTATVRVAGLPGREPLASPSPALATALAAARQAYVDADVTRCLELLAGDRHLELLADGRHDDAARVLFWRLACEVAAGEVVAADVDARAFAAQGLSIPADANVISPEVESRIAAAAPRRVHALEVTASTSGARVMLDGRWRGCVTPCSLDVAPGDHVLRVEADGFAPQHRTIRIDGPLTVDFQLLAASPELAGAQWARGFGAGAAQDGSESLRLLAHAVRAQTLVLLSISGRTRPRLRATVAADGVVLARAEAPWGPEQPAAVLRQLLTRARLLPQPPLYRRPAFWIGLGTAATVAAGVTAAILLQPEVETELRFKK